MKLQIVNETTLVPYFNFKHLLLIRLLQETQPHTMVFTMVCFPSFSFVTVSTSQEASMTTVVNSSLEPIKFRVPFHNYYFSNLKLNLKDICYFLILLPDTNYIDSKHYLRAPCYSSKANFRTRLCFSVC